ncbi:hypothetical protein FPQ18DRAFT_346012 [Pyronema domesticum]|uniref:BTB domain-containing protein n=1 Tax=Pyronema omphalodes (strain CBS 100304) TaxID=1076935 RepID=U4LRF9_PYROM|nr:hypothetical protein FPQ18DRAFT_346012 [Pyronema domesticum]CCX34545.1 Similar to hypothetical protein AOL_s00110g262 [Arthrobotrys oligospora ATCC 24927]; acc. no. EGX46098 [Pyronema omphalodes CBS 100304]
MATCTSCGGCTFNDYGGCDNCGTALDDLTMLDITPPKPFASSPANTPEPKSPLISASDDAGLWTFGSKFTSRTFELLIGPNNKAFYVHKDVLEKKCPYFKTLFGTKMQTRELAENSVTLDSAVDSVSAWALCIEFMYLGDYNIGTHQTLVHAQVYVLAQKLCMEDLKKVALKKMAEYFNKSRQSTVKITDYYVDNWVVKIVQIVYDGTMDYEPNSGILTDYEKSDDNSAPASVMSTSQDPIRRMIACWAALDIVELRKHSAFMELFRNYGDFAVDIMEWVSCGSKPKDFYNISHE